MSPDLPPDAQPDARPPELEPFSFSPSRPDALVSALRAHRHQPLDAPAEKTAEGEGSAS
jgi:hypothetical protein